MIRANNVFVIPGHVIKFELVWRGERLYLNIQTTMNPLDCNKTTWMFLTEYRVPIRFDFEVFLNSFWREIRQGHYVNIKDLIHETMEV